MITVACVECGNYEGRGREYVARLRASVTRHLTQPFRFVCMTDDPRGHEGAENLNCAPGLVGWWNKLALFEPDTFGGRVLYLDLDTVITGPLDELVKHKGLLHLERWGWASKVYGSGVMVWDAGEHAEIWERFTPEVSYRLQGDQDWLTELGGWEALPDGLNVSYRYHCKDGPSVGASTVSFHGRPKMHELPPGHWVHDHWR